MSEHTPLIHDPEHHTPGSPVEETQVRDELGQYEHNDPEEVREPWRVEGTPMSGFWRPAVLLMLLGMLALVLSRVIF